MWLVQTAIVSNNTELKKTFIPSQMVPVAAINRAKPKTL